MRGRPELGTGALAGRGGIGHVRYPTAGSASAGEAQPFFVNSPLGIFLIHNGNLTNAGELAASLGSSDSFFNRHLRTDSDSEVALGPLLGFALPASKPTSDHSRHRRDSSRLRERMEQTAQVFAGRLAYLHGH